MWWASYVFQGTPSFILAKKLAALKLDLKKWNEAEFGNVTFKKQDLWSKLNVLDAKEENHRLTAEEKLEQSNLRTDIEKLLWKRLVGGKKSLMVNGTLSLDQGIIVDYITPFFMNLYTEQQADCRFPDSLVFPMISGDNADWLERPFEEA
ncbi:hypothetical protein RGQ29_031095 [Quercus rubra]|uniref:Uncharacterized protein n=1 Tax=Quercus rubra TaxID=3512 RepID=A0AAN7EK96_QUERU|nr:hypothetical protein RGQ29_031095 [Quercus rubra]